MNAFVRRDLFILKLPLNVPLVLPLRMKGMRMEQKRWAVIKYQVRCWNRIINEWKFVWEEVSKIVF